ncbi:MAG: branched-chain amino acid ABC transporter permease [Lachnospiraceae bacterium]|nr:branched-chain amino acid ABC transporter permease [Lachnospiraceae bacterium]MBR3338993.1 branched-chain amino acid ABC transporter permease [Lachnospiraceae bacterium]
MVSFFTHLINGLSLGSIYAIIAIGYTMVYGIAKMLNFAHGDVIMIGAFMAYTIISTMGLPTPLGIIGAIVICTCLGIVIEKIAYKPLRKAASPLAVLITAIGVSYFLQNSALLIFGSDPKMFTSVVPFQSVTIGSFSIPGTTIVSITVSIILVAALQTFINKTKPGQAMLACSQDRDAASLMGISVNGTITLTFAIGSAMAAIAGVLLCSAYPTLSPTTGAMPGIKAFVAAVFGGIGSIPGAMIGGLVLGVIEILSRAYISSQLSDAIVFSVLIIVLLVKPTGLFGKVIQEKV